MRGRRDGIIGQQGGGGLGECAFGEVVIGDDGVADAGFNQQAADALGGFGGDGALTGAGTGGGALDKDQRTAFHRRYPAYDQGGVTRLALPRREADAGDFVPTGGGALGGEVRLGQHKRAGAAAGQRLAGGIPARATFKIKTQLTDGFGGLAGQFDFKRGGGGEIHGKGFIPGRAVDVAGEGKGEGNAGCR